MSFNADRPAFTLVHGRGHDEWVWHLLQEELGSQDVDTIAVRLPVEDDLSFDEYGALITEAEKKHRAKKIIRVGWSWGINPVVRDVSVDTIQKIIAINGIFTEDSSLPNRMEPLPHIDRSVVYSAIKFHSSLDAVRETADYAFYSSLENDELKEEAKRHLRVHPSTNERPVTDLPYIPMVYIVTGEDHTISKDDQEKIASYFGMSTRYIEDGDHAVMLSRPKQLADMLISIAGIEQLAS